VSYFIFSPLQFYLAHLSLETVVLVIDLSIKANFE